MCSPQTAYGDEGVVRLHKLCGILGKFNDVYEKLPAEEKDAFFQMILMRIHAVYLTMSQYYFSDRSALCCRQGKGNAADLYVKRGSCIRGYEKKNAVLLQSHHGGRKMAGNCHAGGFSAAKNGHVSGVYAVFEKRKENHAGASVE